jgi:copper chaperone
MVKFRVEGMTCGGCARGVTNALQRIDPKAEVAVDLAAKSVTVRSTASADQLRRGIEQAGYRASVSG